MEIGEQNLFIPTETKSNNFQKLELENSLKTFSNFPSFSDFNSIEVAEYRIKTKFSPKDQLKWLNLGNSEITIWKRPNFNQLNELKNFGLTHLVTLQSDGEKAQHL